MYIIFLKFSEQKGKASQFMGAHKAWIKEGIDDDVFIVVGSLQPNLGGCIIASAPNRDELDVRINQDPFVAENIVTAEVFEITPSLVNRNLDFLMPQSS